MNTTVSRASAEDLERVIELDAHFPHPWKPEDWRSLSSHQFCFVLKKEEKTIGYALFSYLEGDEEAHLLKIYLDKEWRQSGLATVLFEEASSLLRVSKFFLEVGETNVAAQRFYEKIGFNKVHLAKNFYSNGESAWLMLLAR